MSQPNRPAESRPRKLPHAFCGLSRAKALQELGVVPPPTRNWFVSAGQTLCITPRGTCTPTQMSGYMSTAL